jgi:sugar/nucleoside kinase (ribokinase family)
VIDVDFAAAPRVPTDRAKDLDPCGAGDVFSAYAMVGAISTDPRLDSLERTLSWACSAATASCLQKGTTQITWSPDDRVLSRLGVSCHADAP